MKVAFSSAGETLESALDQRFGRATNFLIYDTDSETFTVVDNAQNLNASQGAGIQSAQNVAAAGAECLVTGHTGPKAFSVLQAAGITVFLSQHATVKQALDAWKLGSLVAITGADVESHWI